MRKSRSNVTMVADMFGADGNGGLAKELLTWVFRVSLLAAVFWVQGNFVNKEKYDKDRDSNVAELHAIATNVQKITDRLETASELPSYEGRIKRVEEEVRDLKVKK